MLLHCYFTGTKIAYSNIRSLTVYCADCVNISVLSLHSWCVQVAIRDVDEAAMELLVDFCYTSTVVVEESNVQTLLPAACLLQLAEIQDVCCEFLQKQLDPSNCLGIRAFADTHACRDLLRKADKYTQQHFTSVCF